MSDNKAPARIRVSNTFRVRPTDKPVSAYPSDTLYISAAALRELVEKWEKLNEKLHLQYPHDYAGYYYDAAQELEQLLEADR